MCTGVVGDLKGDEASQDPVCDHHRHGTAKRAHSLLRGSPREGQSITEPAGVSSKQLGAQRVNKSRRQTWKQEDTETGRVRDKFRQ